MNTEVKKPPAIPMSPVESSQLHAIGHDPETNTLSIQFKGKDGGGSVYHYDNFTGKDFEEFKSAKSFGSHFKTHIKPHVNKHPYRKIS